MTIDDKANAELHRLEPMKSEARMSPKYLKSGICAELIAEIMAKPRAVDRRIYSITIGDCAFNYQQIEDHNNRADLAKI
jgi:hypothetical protein